MKLTVAVEDMHIRCGFRGSPCLCPVKLAIDPKLPAFWKCRVYDHSLDIGNARGSWITIPLPPEVVITIEIYDKGGTMAPFQFDLWIPDAMFL